MKPLSDAIDATLARKRAAGVFDAAGCACSVVQALALEDPEQWAILRDQLALEALTAQVQRESAGR